MARLILNPILRFKTDLDDVASKSFFFNLVSQVIIYCIWLGSVCLGAYLLKWSVAAGVIVMTLGPIVGFWLFSDLPESRPGRSLEKEAFQSGRAQHLPPRNGIPFELFILKGPRLN